MERRNHLLRISIAAPIAIPAALQGRPWWQLFAITFAALIGAGLVEHGVRTRHTDRSSAVIAIVAGAAIALTAFCFMLAPVIASSTPTAARDLTPYRSTVDAAPPIAPAVRKEGTWKAISIRERTACGIREDKTVWCWGRVAPKDAPTPQRMPGLDNATAIATGFTSQCAIVDGAAWCWGWNYDGSVGVKPTNSHDLRTEPVRVPIDEPLTAIAAGTGHTCALAASGAVWCWGANEAGQCGVAPATKRRFGSMDPSPTSLPIKVAVAPARAIAAGRGISCAIERDDGAVVCWGDLAVENSSEPTISPPSRIPGVDRASAVAAGEMQACAVMSTGVACWGLGAHRRKAEGIVVHPDAAGASAITVGYHNVCVLLSNDARCWGANYQGQLGDGTRVDSETAVPVAGLPKVVALAAGEIESCGLTSSGELWCWAPEERR